MRKFAVILMILSLLCAFASAAFAEEEAETLLYAPLEEGEETARVIGVESVPQARAYDSFSQRFIEFMQTNFDYTPVFSGPYFSDGAWTYVVEDGSSIMLVKTAGAQAEAQVQSVLLSGVPDEEYGLVVLAAVAFNSAAKCGAAGQNALNMLLIEPEPERFFDFSTDYWQENGFSLSFSPNEFGLPTASIAYAEPALVDVPADFDWENPPTILNGPSYAAFNDYIAAHAADLMVDAASGDVTQENGEATVTYSYQWGECAVTVDVNKALDAVEMISISFSGEETDDLWNRTMLLFLAAAQAADEDIAPILNLNGGAGNWAYLSSLEPFAYLNSAALKCFADEESEGPVYSAMICGAIEYVIAE